ncbi:hypothetical protein ABZ816_17745 [Actinosynnema sp. NPDC047251]|uniref:hypothetical protein n=1 Tax=Saccharothrix espanaensis TaxID=103731 RepID=UPI0011DCCDD6|nr:hypothetical protein [Saccharothrix espanaensis]
MAGTECGDDSVMRFALAGLVMAAVTNVVVALSDAVVWAWWVAGSCLALALVLGLAWTVRRVRTRDVAREDVSARDRARAPVR